MWSNLLKKGFLIISTELIFLLLFFKNKKQNLLFNDNPGLGTGTKANNFCLAASRNTYWLTQISTWSQITSLLYAEFMMKVAIVLGQTPFL